MAATLQELTSTPTGQRLVSEHETTIAERRKAAAEAITAAETVRDAELDDLQKKLATAEKKVKTAEVRHRATQKEVTVVRGEMGNAVARCKRACRGLRDELASTAPPEIAVYQGELVATEDALRRANRNGCTGMAERAYVVAKLEALRKARTLAEALRFEVTDATDGLEQIRRGVQEAFAAADERRHIDGGKERNEAIHAAATAHLRDPWQ